MKWICRVLDHRWTPFEPCGAYCIERHCSRCGERQHIRDYPGFSIHMARLDKLLKQIPHARA